MLFVVIVLITSIFAWAVGTRLLRLSGRTLPAAGLLLIECVGLAVVFGIANMAVTVGIVVVSRSLGLGFVSAYLTGDPIWLVFSFLQAVTFQLWRGVRPTP